MKIPNYDQRRRVKSFKQVKGCEFMPQDTFRMLIAEPSGSGKTNLLVFMTKTPLVYYDKVFLYARKLEQDKYKSLIEDLGLLVRKLATTSWNVATTLYSLLESLIALARR